MAHTGKSRNFAGTWAHRFVDTFIFSTIVKRQRRAYKTLKDPPKGLQALRKLPQKQQTFQDW